MARSNDFSRYFTPVIIPMSACLHSCLLCCLGWRGDQLLLASRRGGHEASDLSSQSQSALSLERGGSTAKLSEFGDPDSLLLSSTTQEDFRSSATSEYWELGDSCGFSELGDSGSGTVNTDHRSATMWV